MEQRFFSFTKRKHSHSPTVKPKINFLEQVSKNYNQSLKLGGFYPKFGVAFNIFEDTPKKLLKECFWVIFLGF